MQPAEMIAALDTIEAGLQQLAAGVTTFTDVRPHQKFCRPSCRWAAF